MNSYKKSRRGKLYDLLVLDEIKFIVFIVHQNKTIKENVH
jgi:hypothetical protein